MQRNGREQRTLVVPIEAQQFDLIDGRTHPTPRSVDPIIHEHVSTSEEFLIVVLVAYRRSIDQVLEPLMRRPFPPEMMLPVETAQCPWC